MSQHFWTNITFSSDVFFLKCVPYSTCLLISNQHLNYFNENLYPFFWRNKHLFSIPCDEVSICYLAIRHVVWEMSQHTWRFRLNRTDGWILFSTSLFNSLRRTPVVLEGRSRCLPTVIRAWRAPGSDRLFAHLYIFKSVCKI